MNLCCCSIPRPPSHPCFSKSAHAGAWAAIVVIAERGPEIEDKLGASRAQDNILISWEERATPARERERSRARKETCHLCRLCVVSSHFTATAGNVAIAQSSSSFEKCLRSPYLLGPHRLSCLCFNKQPARDISAVGGIIHTKLQARARKTC